jgi:hypothetical protein
MPLGFDLEHGKSIFFVKKRDPFDQAGEAFGNRFWRWCSVMQFVQFWSGRAMETSGSCTFERTVNKKFVPFQKGPIFSTMFSRKPIQLSGRT